MCPPIGFRAPPATKVIVAPGSAIAVVSHWRQARDTFFEYVHCTWLVRRIATYLEHLSKALRERDSADVVFLSEFSQF